MNTLEYLGVTHIGADYEKTMGNISSSKPKKKTTPKMGQKGK